MRRFITRIASQTNSLGQFPYSSSLCRCSALSSVSEARVTVDPSITSPSPESTHVEPQKQKMVSFVHHPYSLAPSSVHITSKASSDSAIASANPSLFAIVEFSGTQFKITEDDTFVANKLENVDIGSVLDLENVLMIGSKAGTVVGHPYIPGAKVTVEVEEITKDRKVIIFKMRRRKNSKRTRGFRRSVTVLRVKSIELGDHIQEFSKRLL